MKALFRRWQSRADKTFGQELISRPLSPRSVAGALRPVLSDSVEGAFLLARLASSDHAGVCTAMRAIQELRAPVRIALLIDLPTLQGLEEAEIAHTDAVGLVLDGVTVATPLSAFTLDAIEAVRFDDCFAKRF